MGSMTGVDITAWAETQILEAIRVAESVRAWAPRLSEVALKIADVFQKGGRAFFFGNGGSAADAQHWAAELSGRFYQQREGLPAIALTTNASAITAIANDYGFDEVFARQVEAMGKRGDVAIGISTSGRSKNVLRAFEVARERGMITIGFTGGAGQAMRAYCDHIFEVPSHDVARIQEGHELCGHIVCAIVERVIFSEGVQR